MICKDCEFYLDDSDRCVKEDIVINIRLNSIYV